MKNFFYLTIAIIIILTGLLVFNNYRKSKCGDNMCQKWEQRRSSCPQDCAPKKSDKFPDSQSYKIKSIKTIAEKGGRVDWSPTGDYIAYDSKGDDGFYDIWTMNPDGSNKACITCGKSGIPQKMNGNPTVHFSGNYIAFQAEDPALFSKLKILERFATHPGGGLNNNLWIADKNGTRFWQLTNIGARMAVLHPHFSKDGTKILWAEKVNNDPGGWGDWVIKIADFSIDNSEPEISNVNSVKPGNLQFFETHGFSPDKGKITFSAFARDDQKKTYNSKLTAFDEYSYDLITEKLIRLTSSSSEWDEFAQYAPDGKHIFWMSSMGNIQERDKNGNLEGGNTRFDYWLMNPDGTDQQRLTHFNVPGYAESDPKGIAAAEFSFRPDGQSMAAKIRRLPSKFNETEEIIIIEFEK